ncbi:MAG: hypothetical protein ACE5JO_14685 [Candidatus Binatia bacterium]
MSFHLFSSSRKRGTPIEATIEVERYNTGVRRYEARPLRMAVRGKVITFRMEDFIAYGWTARAARRRCLKKVLPYLTERAKVQKE